MSVSLDKEFISLCLYCSLSVHATLHNTLQSLDNHPPNTHTALILFLHSTDTTWSLLRSPVHFIIGMEERKL